MNFLVNPSPLYAPRLARLAVTLLASVGVALPVCAAQQPVLRFDAPATSWEQEGLPIGNGALGAVIAGGLERDLIQFNEKTLWTGGPGAEGYDFGWPVDAQGDALAQVRETIDTQGSIAPEAAAKLLGHKITAYGDYQTFGDLIIVSPKNDSGVKNYRRELSLADSQVDVTYEQGGVRYRREYLASYPDGVIAIKYSADQPAQISFELGLDIPDNRRVEVAVEQGKITAQGSLHSNGLNFETQIQVLNSGGQVSAVDGKKIQVSAADSVVILLVAGTDYAQAYPKYRGAHPHQRLQAQLKRAAKKSFEQIQAAHRADYQALFNRVALNIGQQELS